MFPRSFAFALSAFVVVMLGACTKQTPPEQRLRALIETTEQAVEKKDVATVRDHVSEQYTDEDGRDRKAVEGILKLYLIRNESIHLLTRIESITIPEPNRAQAVVYVAMAARPISSAAELRAFNANLYRFEVTFALEKGDWRIARASWRPAEPTDFIHS